MPITQKVQSSKVKQIEFDFEPLVRERADNCYHRLPQVGQYYLLNCFETYNQCELLVEVVEEPVKPKSRSYFARWWSSSKPKPKKEKQVEYKSSYLSFIEGYCVILEYTKVLPLRDYGEYFKNKTLEDD